MTKSTEALTQDALALEEQLLSALEQFPDDGTPERSLMRASFMVHLAIARVVRMRGVQPAGQMVSCMIAQPTACFQMHPMVQAQIGSDQPSRPSRMH